MSIYLFFFFNDTATTEIYTLSLHDALPISFEPGPVVTMYTCGITPYDAAHLGHAATYIVYDVLQRRLRDMGHRDRKSTRLNSSHANISYAVFCLKKKKTKLHNTLPTQISKT